MYYDTVSKGEGNFDYSLTPTRWVLIISSPRGERIEVRGHYVIILMF
jgi:hypothetical protein